MRPPGRSLEGEPEPNAGGSVQPESPAATALVVASTAARPRPARRTPPASATMPARMETGRLVRRRGGVRRGPEEGDAEALTEGGGGPARRSAEQPSASTMSTAISGEATPIPAQGLEEQPLAEEAVQRRQPRDRDRATRKHGPVHRIRDEPAVRFMFRVPVAWSTEPPPGRSKALNAGVVET